VAKEREARCDTPARRVRRLSWAGTAFLLVACTFVGTVWPRAIADPSLPSAPLAVRPAPTHLAVREPVRSAGETAAQSASRLEHFVPLVRIDLPAPPSEVEPSAVALASISPTAELPLPLPPEPPEAPVLAVLRPVDVEQIAQAGEQSPEIAQIDDPEPASALPERAEKTQIAQLSVPRAVERELALLQEDAPAEVAVRFGDRTVGKVAIRVSQINTIDVQLSGLLDVMADRFTPEAFARLRNSSAADSYVSLDQLRAAGLGLRYDPIYDELVVNA
jgi:hypothetical protein